MGTAIEDLDMAQFGRVLHQRPKETNMNRILTFGGDVRCAGEWRFEGGGFVQILIGGEVPTAEALEMVDILVALKREELARKATAESAPAFKAAQNSAESDPAVTSDCAGAGTLSNGDRQ